MGVILSWEHCAGRKASGRFFDLSSWNSAQGRLPPLDKDRYAYTPFARAHFLIPCVSKASIRLKSSFSTSTRYVMHAAGFLFWTHQLWRKTFYCAHLPLLPIPGGVSQNSWPEYKFCVLARSVSGVGVWWIIWEWNPWSPVQNGAKHERKQLVSSLTAVCSCIFINPGWLVGLEHLVAAKDSRWGLLWRVSAIWLAHQRVLEPDVLAVCHWGAQIISAPFCASPGKAKEWNLGIKCHEETLRSNTGMLWFNLLCKLKSIWLSLSSKAFFIARNAVSFGSTLVLLSGKNAPEII